MALNIGLPYEIEMNIVKQMRISCRTNNNYNLVGSKLDKKPNKSLKALLKDPGPYWLLRASSLNAEKYLFNCEKEFVKVFNKI